MMEMITPMMYHDDNVYFHNPFSPIIMEAQVPKRFVDIINTTADKVLGSEAASV